MERVLARVEDKGQLRKVDALLHDMAFDMPEASFDEEQAVLEINLYRSERTHDVLSSRLGDYRSNLVPGEKAYLLRIGHVFSCTRRDPDGLVTHSYSHLEASGDSKLSLLSNFPGSIDMEVSEVDVQVLDLEGP